MPAKDTKTKVIIESSLDPSSSSIATYLRENYFHCDDSANPVFKDNTVLYRIDKLHLYHENIADELGKNGLNPSLLIFLSKHSSSAHIKSLTVHAMGNFAQADLGGQPGTLSECDPSSMSSAFRILAEEQVEGFNTTLEATHHGPLTMIPSFFIEIGTEPEDWSNESALAAVSRAVIESEMKQEKGFVGVGGGHYSPKITNEVRSNGINIGHIISKHSQESLTPVMIQQASRRTVNFAGILMDRKGTRGPIRQMIRNFVDETGCELVTI